MSRSNIVCRKIRFNIKKGFFQAVAEADRPVLGFFLFQAGAGFFLRKMLDTRYGSVGTRFL